MATAGGANPWVVSMQSGQGGAMACRPSSSCALLLPRAPSGLSLVASQKARFIGILSSPRSRTPLNVFAIHAQDPDFYKIPYVEGIPVGKRLKLWNLPPNCKHSELLEWFAGIDVKVESLEFTDDPVLNAQGIGGFVEFATKQHACIAIVRLDGYKFRGHYIRMDFAEKRPHSRDYGSRRNRPNRSSSSSSHGSFATSSRPPVTDMVPSYGVTTSANSQLTPRYEAANSSTVQASSGFGSGIQSANAQLTPTHEAANSSAVQASSDYGSSTQSSDFYRNSAVNSEGIQSNPSYGNTPSTSGYGSTSPSGVYGATQFPPGHGSAPSGFGSGIQSANAQSTPRHEAANSSAVQASSDYGSSKQSSDFYRNSAVNSEGIQSNSSYGSTPSTSGYGSTLPSGVYGATQFPPGHGSAPSSSISGGSVSDSRASTLPNTQSAPSYDITPENGDALNRTTEYYPLPSASAYGSPQSTPSYGNTAGSGSTLQHIPNHGNSHSSDGSSQQPASYNGTELNGQSTTVPSTPTYNNRSRAPPYGNRSVQPLYSDGTVTGKSFKSGSGWPANTSPQGTVNYGVDRFPKSSYSSQPSSSTNVSNNQSDSAFGKSFPLSYDNSSPQLASSMGKNPIQSGSSYGSIKDTGYGSGNSPSSGDSNPPSVLQSSPSHGSVNTQSVQSSFGSSQVPADSSSPKSSPGSLSIPPQPSYGPSARSSATQGAPSAYDGTKISPIGTVSSNDRASLQSPVAQGPPSRPLNLSYAKQEPYEDPFKNYGAPDAAEVEPWSQNTSFRSGAMFGSPQPSSLNRLFVGNLAASIDDATLQELFSKFGTVLEARVLRDQESGRSRGFAVVAMSSVDEIKAASKALDGWRIESRPLKVDAVTFNH